MKKYILLVISSILLMSCSSNTNELCALGNIENSGFEEGLDYWYGKNFKKSDSFSYENESSLLLTSTNNKEAYVYQTIKNLKNGYYYLEVESYNKGNDEYCYVYAKNVDNIEYKTMVPRYISSKEWITTTVRGIEVKNNELVIGIKQLGDNKAYFDNFKLTLESNQVTQYQTLQGGCISWLDYEEDNGAKYYNFDSKEEDCLKILHDNGINFVRLELYNDPGTYKDINNNYLPSKYKNEDSILKLAKRAKTYNMEIQLSFMYSSYWGNYAIPNKWLNEINTLDSFENKITKLGDFIYDFTYSYMNRLSLEGITPKYVSIGNEIDEGILLPYGSIESHPEQLAYLLNKGYEAIKNVNEDIDVVIHLGCNASDLHYSSNYGGGRYFFDTLKKYNLKYDVIGTSFYPYWAQSDDIYASKSKLDLSDLKKWSELMIDTYDKDILIMETGYNWGKPNQLANNGAYENIYPSSKEGQRDYVINFLNTIKSIKDGRAKGSLYWDPILVKQENVGYALYDDGKARENVVETTTFFDYDHKALPVLNAYKYNSNSQK